MKTRQSGIAVFADALATTFSLFPHGDYRTAYPHKSAAKRMDEAWSRTGKDMRSALNGVVRKHGSAR
ncbi:hypothetical protein [Trinickia mobilis]|uniref:hypothetical protein n=1 Tax=Trinickia mobilis TaxID=2816356 RepID=UPI001A8FB2E5|nr:hypothetical protein [Trinickia mobilis]